MTSRVEVTFRCVRPGPFAVEQSNSPDNIKHGISTSSHVDTHQPADLQGSLQLSSPSLLRPRPSPYHVGSLQVPFSESPGYDSLARRFSSYPSPLKLSALGSWQKATDSSEYVDIRDLQSISDPELNNDDVLIGYLYGAGRRAMVPCVVSYGNKAYWVHFLVGTGAPATFLSEKVHTPTDVESYA